MNIIILFKMEFFNGPQVTATLRQITGKTDDVLHGDKQHFWPYGLNYISEVKSTDDLIYHCKIVNAMYHDMFNERFYGVFRIKSIIDGRYTLPSGTNALALSNRTDSTSLVRVIALGGKDTFRLEFGNRVLEIPDESVMVGKSASVWPWNGKNHQKVVIEFQRPDTTTLRFRMLHSGTLSPGKRGYY